MSLLTICQDAADAIGIARPSAVASSSDASARQLGVFARQALQEIADRHDWQQLVMEGSITLATGDQDYALPADFHRLIYDTTWDRTSNRQQGGPITPQEWAFAKGFEFDTEVYRRFRIIGGEIEFADTITAGDNGATVYFEYISSNKALNGSTPVANLTVDTYTSRISEHVVTLRVIALYKQAKGIQGWQVDAKRFEDELAKLAGWQKGSRSLCMDGGTRKADYPNIKDRDLGP